MSTLLWLQGSCCGGETVSLINADQPDIVTTLENLGYNLIWHPSFAMPQDLHMEDVLDRMLSGKAKLGVLIVEGAIYNKPEAGPQPTDRGDNILKTFLSSLRQLPITRLQSAPVRVSVA
jgi:Ni,Fe-hydrogenase I small subunit